MALGRAVAERVLTLRNWRLVKALGILDENLCGMVEALRFLVGRLGCPSGHRCQSVEQLLIG